MRRGSTGSQTACNGPVVVPREDAEMLTNRAYGQPQNCLSSTLAGISHSDNDRRLHPERSQYFTPDRWARAIFGFGNFPLPRTDFWLWYHCCSNR
jgi:hypothetical protein